MNVSTLAQIAQGNPVRQKYLNTMKLSEMAQTKRGIAESNEGRGYDKMGQAILAGTKHSVGVRKAYGAPNQDTIDRWSADIERRGIKAESQARRSLGAAQGARPAYAGGAGQTTPIDIAATEAPAQTGRGRGARYRGQRMHGRGRGRGGGGRGTALLQADTARYVEAQRIVSKAQGYAAQVEHIKGTKKKLPKSKYGTSGAHNPYW